MSGDGRKLLRYARGHRWALGAVLGLVALVGLLESLSSVLIGPVFAAFLVGSKTPPIAAPFLSAPLDFSQLSAGLLLGLLVASTIGKAAAEYGAVTATAYLGQAIVRELRNNVFDNILRQPLEFFHGNPTGELIS